MRLKHCDISLINIGEEIDTATFTTSLKLSQHFKTEDEKQLTTYIQPLSRNTEIYSKYRTTIKIGRLIRKLFGSQFSDSEIEEVRKYCINNKVDIIKALELNSTLCLPPYQNKFNKYS